ncbi:nitrogenase component 1 [Selenomonas sp. F0473]|uniref:nitrogenase component 1 n=1 Tax=Selenomonas sp. F0473 TaxID=999423 RepID=UPI0025DF28DF|nr:nitrogenase component 1 [Selenomonas sp. F0473]
MERIIAEEIKSFDTSMDALWSRHDLVLLASGSLICLRAVYQRAALRGVLSQLRYAILREEDYAIGMAEEKIRDAVRRAAMLQGARVIVIYLSCLDILIRLDFSDIEACLSAETGRIVRCFFRGPLAKADAIPHETAKELLRRLPPEKTRVAAPAPLPPPMSDIAGVNDLLRGSDAVNVLVTPSGCRSPLARTDMMRERRDVYAALPEAEDYIFGMEETVRAQVDTLAERERCRTLNILSSPVPAFMGLQEEFVMENLPAQNCYGRFFETNGFRDAVAGIAAATLFLVREAADAWATVSRGVYVLGWSAILGGERAQFETAERLFAAYGYTMHMVGADELPEYPALVWAVSAAGVPAAEWIRANRDIPMLRTLPLSAVGTAVWERDVCAALGVQYKERMSLNDETICPREACGGECVLLIGDPIASEAIANVLRRYGRHNLQFAAYAWTSETAELYRHAAEGGEIFCFCTREELQPVWDAADIVVADPVYCAVLGEKRIVPLPSGFLSGRNAALPGGGVLGDVFYKELMKFLGQ